MYIYFPLFHFSIIFCPHKGSFCKLLILILLQRTFFFVSTTGILHFVLWLIPPIKCSGNYCLAMRSSSL